MEKASSSTSDQNDVVSPELGTQLSQTVSRIVLSVLDIVRAVDNPQTRDALRDLAKGYALQSNGERGRETGFVPTLGYEMRVAPITLAMEAAEPKSKSLKPVFRQYQAAIKESLTLKAKDDEIAFLFESCGFRTASVINVGIYLREIRREMEEAAHAPIAGPPPVSASSSAPPTAAAKALPPSDKAPTRSLAPEPSKANSIDHGLAFNPSIARPGLGEPAAALNAAKTSVALPDVEQPANRVATGAPAGAKASLPPGYPFNMASKPPSGGQAGIPTDIKVTDGGPHPPHRETSSPQSRVTSPPADLDDDDDGFVARSDRRPYATPPHPLFARTSRETHVDTTQPLFPTTNSTRDFVGSETSEADDGFGADLQRKRIELARPPLTRPSTAVSQSGRAAAQSGDGSDPRRSPHPNTGSSASPPSQHVDHVQEGAGFRRSAAQPPPNRVPSDSEAQNDRDGPLPPRKPSQGEPP